MEVNNGIVYDLAVANESNGGDFLQRYAKAVNAIYHKPKKVNRPYISLTPTQVAIERIVGNKKQKVKNRNKNKAAKKARRKNR